MPIENKELILLSNQIHGEGLRTKLVPQINKDANLSGIDFNLNERYNLTSIANELNELIIDLIKNNFDSYLNFLYRIDISETDLIKIRDTVLIDLSKKVTILILKKELQKVLFKNKNR
jgi:hypothetical protein